MNIIDLDTEREIRKGFQDNHGRTWVRCRPGDIVNKTCTWNFPNGRKVLCRLKYPHEHPNIEIQEDAGA
jgi:hypothetical protein